MRKNLIIVLAFVFLCFVGTVIADVMRIYVPESTTERYQKIRPDYPLPVLNTRGTIARETTSQDLSSAVLDYTTAFGGKINVHGVMIHSTASITEDVVITFNSLTGVSYDTVIDSQTFAGADISYMPAGRLILASGDEIDVNCSKDNNTGTIYVTVIGEELTQ